MVLELIFAQTDLSALLFFADMNQNSLIMRLIKLILWLIPVFPYSICFGAIQKVACTHLDGALLANLPGRKYTWTDFGLKYRGTFGSGDTYTISSPLRSLLILTFDMLLICILTWYFDHTIASNRGVAE